MAEDKLIAVPETLLTDIGDAIRLKRDLTTPIPVPDMAMQIGLIEGGCDNATLKSISELILSDTFSIEEDIVTPVRTTVYTDNSISFDKGFLHIVDIFKKKNETDDYNTWPHFIKSTSFTSNVSDNYGGSGPVIVHTYNGRDKSGGYIGLYTDYYRVNNGFSIAAYAINDVWHILKGLYEVNIYRYNLN